MNDLISRQAAIDFIDAGHLCNPNEPRWSDNEIINFLKSRPSAQPDATDINVGTTIYRQAAIDAMCGACSDWCDEGVCKKVSAIQKLPSAQPEMVKCKKCRYVYYDEEFGNYWCDRMSDSFKVEADGYCKWGK